MWRRHTSVGRLDAVSSAQISTQVLITSWWLGHIGDHISTVCRLQAGGWNTKGVIEDHWNQGHLGHWKHTGVTKDFCRHAQEVTRRHMAWYCVAKREVTHAPAFKIELDHAAAPSDAYWLYINGHELGRTTCFGTWHRSVWHSEFYFCIFLVS